ncbi:MAG: hypothetical protein ACI4WH_01505 [Oscillospiraceae bacterium]
MRYIEKDFCNGKKLITSLLLILILIGVIFGVWLVCSRSDWKYLLSPIMTQGLIKEYSQKTILEVFLNSFTWTGILLMIIYFCGYSAISHPITLGTIFFRGIALGISISSTYIEYQSKGVLIYLLLMMFNIIVSSIVLVFATMDSLIQSTTITCTILGRSSELFKIKKYNLKFLMYLTIITLSSIADTCLLYLFIDKVY